MKIVDTTLSGRVKNILRRNGIFTTEELIELYDNSLDKTTWLTGKTKEDIITFCNEMKNNTFVFDKELAKTTDLNNKKAKVEKKRIDSTNRKLLSRTIPEFENEDIKKFTHDFLYSTELRDYILNKAKEYIIDPEDMSSRAYNILRRSGISHLNDVLERYPDNYSEMKYLGKTTVHELQEYSLKKLIQLREQTVFDKVINIDAYVAEDRCMGKATVNANTMIFNTNYQKLISEYFSFYDIGIIDLDLPDKILKKLYRNGCRRLSQLIAVYPDNLEQYKLKTEIEISEISKIINKILAEHNDKIVAYCMGDKGILYTDNRIKEMVKNCFNGTGFRGLCFKQLRDMVTEDIDDERLKKVIDSLSAEKELEFVDSRWYKVFPSFNKTLHEHICELDDRHRDILLRRYNGETLASIAEVFDLTRERVRQISNKASEYLFNNIYIEDYYAYLYETYEVDSELWKDYLGVSQNTLKYLNMRYSAGERNIYSAIDDENIDYNIKYRIQNYLDRNNVLIDGKRIERNRAKIEDYILITYCGEEMSFDEFVNIYNNTLKRNRIPFDEDIYLTEEVKRTRINKISASMNCLWKQGERFRYYGIIDKDYLALLEGINIKAYENVEISTLKWFNENPDLMRQYDIHDQYELHNLLKKIIRNGEFNDIKFGRQPNIEFGEFDRDKAIYDIICMLSPVSIHEITDYINNEYGYDKGTCYNYLKPFMHYYHNGIFSVHFTTMPEDRKNKLLSVLDENFYYTKEIIDIYFSMFPTADRDEINPYTLKQLGFIVLSNYLVKGYPSAESFFRSELTKYDLFDISPLRERYGKIVMYNQVLLELRTAYALFPYTKDKYISFNKLQKLNISKKDILGYCDAVYNEMTEGSFFTIHSLKNQGFTLRLGEIGFDDYFYANLIAVDTRFMWQRVFGEIVLLKGIDKEGITVKRFILSLLSGYDHVHIDDIIIDCKEKYGIVVPDRYEITEAISGTEYYYDPISKIIYSNKELHH